MTQQVYQELADGIRAGKCVYHSGRSANTIQELDWIYDVVNRKPAPEATGAPAEAKQAAPKATPKPKAAGDKAKRVRPSRAKAKPVEDAGAPVFAVVDGERVDLTKLGGSALLAVADKFGVVGADSMAAAELVAAVKAMADKAAS